MVDRVPGHQLPARDEFQIPKRDVLPIAILEPHTLPSRRPAMRFPPKQDVLADPIARRVSGVGNFFLEVAIHQPSRTDRPPGLRALALLESRLDRLAASGPALHSLVERNVPLRESTLRADVVSATQPAGVRTGQVRGALVEAQVERLGVDPVHRASQQLRDLPGRRAGVQLPQRAHGGGRPQFACSLHQHTPQYGTRAR